MRLIFPILIALCLGLALPATAETAQDRVVRELRQQGYDSFSGQRTLLGRVRIVATAPGWRREVVLNPRTGEILRDYARRLKDDDDRTNSGTDDNSDKTSGTGGTASDRENEADNRDDREDDDKSERDEKDEKDDRDEEDEEDEDDEDEDEDEDEDD